MSGVLVVVEQREGRIGRISWEAVAAGVGLGAQLGVAVSAAVIGAQTEALAAEIAGKALGKVVRVEHPLLAPYTADGFSLALEQLIKTEQPDYVIFPHTYQVRDYAPALAARLGQVLISDVTGIGDGPVFTRQLLQGRLNGSYRPAGSGPRFLSVQAGAFRAEAAGSGAAEVIVFSPTLDPAQIRSRPGEPFRGSAQTVDLGSAQMIVAVGRGIKDAENMPLVEGLAAALGAEMAASRPICDNGWLPMERQVGSSGPDRRAQALPGRRHLRRHSAPGGHEGLAMHRGHQQGPRRAHLRGSRLRHRRRSLRGGSGADRSGEGGQAIRKTGTIKLGSMSFPKPQGPLLGHVDDAVPHCVQSRNPCNIHPAAQVKASRRVVKP